MSLRNPLEHEVEEDGICLDDVGAAPPPHADNVYRVAMLVELLVVEFDVEGVSGVFEVKQAVRDALDGRGDFGVHLQGLHSVKGN